MYRNLLCMKMKDKKDRGVEFPYLCEDNESGTGDNQNANEEKENITSESLELADANYYVENG